MYSTNFIFSFVSKCAVLSVFRIPLDLNLGQGNTM